MAVPLLIGLTKALVTQAPKLAAKQLGKKAVKNAAKDFVKGKVKDKFKSKREQDKKKKGGALVETEGGLTKYSMGFDSPSKISPQKLIPQGVDLDASTQTVSAKGKISYDKIQQQLDNIEGVTSALNKAFKQQLDAKKDTAAKAKKAAQTLRKKQREEDREGKKKVDTSSGSLLPKGDPFNIFNFLKNILLGGLVLFLVKQGPKIAKLFGFLKDNLYAVFLGIKYGLKAFKGAFKALGKLLRGTVKAGFKIAAAPFKLAGRVIKTLFGKIGKGIMAFGKYAIKRFKDLLGIKPPPKPGKPGSGDITLTGTGAGVGSGSGAGRYSRTDARGNQIATRGRNYRNQLGRVGPARTTVRFKPGSPMARLNSARANLQTGTLFKKGANLQRATYRAAAKTQKVAQTTNSFLKTLLGIGGAKDIARLKTASPVLKKASNFMKGARIPVLGPMIVFTMTALDPDPETGGIGRAAFKAIGAGLGEFLGFGIPIPVLGPIIGGLLGEVMGDVAYELIVNKSPEAAGAKIMNAVGAVAKVGGQILDWMKGVVGRFWEALPKLKLPEKIGPFSLPFGLGGMEILDPKMFMGPYGLLGAFGTMGKAMVTAIFQPDKEEKGKVDDKSKTKVDDKSKTKENEITSTTDGASPASPGPMGGTPSQQQAFKQVYDIAARVGGANFPEVVAAQAMHETGYLANPNSVYFKTGKTNAFGQTINASEVGTNGIVDKIYFRDRYWAVYDSLESSVKHNIKLWHNVNTNSGNYNAFSTPLQGIASVAPAYSPNADKANIALGYTVDAYSKGMVRALKLGGYDPKGKRGQTSKITTTTTNPPGVRPVNPSTSPTEAQKKRIQELQKKIAEAEALLKVSGFASGPIANITKQNLATNKAELAKLSAMAMTPMIPQTTSPATVTPQAQTAGSALERAGQTTGTQKGDMVSGYGVTSGYGQRWGKPHGGIDIGTPTGTYVGLSVPVEIVYAGNHGGYGNVIDAWAPSIGLQFRLAHLSRIMVSKGQVVAAGTALGLTGGGLNDPGRGSSTGPHLHFEVDNKKNGTTYGGLGDPSPYVQYIILSKNGPALGAQVTTPGSVTTQRNAGAISQFPSYDANGSNTIILPGQQQQQPVMMGGQSAGGIVLGGSTAAVVNSYYKKQLLGFLYKQG